MIVIAAESDDVLGGVGNVQVAARLTNRGASASRVTNSFRSYGLDVREGAAEASCARRITEVKVKAEILENIADVMKVLVRRKERVG